MTKESESIFSWRRELKGLSREERARWFYDRKLLPTLSDEVMSAEIARQQQNHNLVGEIWDRWSQQPELRLKKLENRQNRLGIDLWQQREKMKVGFAGLGRIRHVDTNSQIRAALAGDEETGKLKGQVEEVGRLYGALGGVESLIHETIHDGSIHWISEVAQDRARTYELLGDRSGALETISKAIEKTEELVKQEENSQNKLYWGSLSALSVLYARRGRLTQDLSDLGVALDCAGRYWVYEKNAHRLATLSVWSIEASFKFPGASVSSRVKLFGQALLCLTKAFFYSPSEATRSLKQFAKGK